MRIALVLLLIVSGCNQQTTTSSQQPEREFKEFIAADGSFTILFPVPPTVTRDPPNPALGKVAGASYSSIIGPDEYDVMYSEFNQPSRDPAGEFQAGTENVLRVLGGKLLWDREISVKGNPGHEIFIEYPDRTFLRKRSVMAGNGLYQISVMAPNEEKYRQFAQTFTASFQLSD
jgi:hypothetical protein